MIGAEAPLNAVLSMTSAAGPAVENVLVHRMIGAEAPLIAILSMTSAADPQVKERRTSSYYPWAR
eukprot:6213012-Pyramimonas_sp.AAC.1